MPKRSLFISGVALLLIAGSIVIPGPQDKIVFLDVGQGDSILIQKQTMQVLIDGGAGMKVLERLREELPWFDKKINVVISTHPDKDHLEGLLHVLERYGVDLVLLPPIAHTSQLQEAWLTQLQQLSQRNTISYRFAQSGQKLTFEDVTIDVMGPSSAALALASAGKTNNASVITRVQFGELDVLLTGDAERSAEKVLIASHLRQGLGGQAHPLDVDVLKAGHHGSKTSTSAELLTATTPSLVAISVGANNRYGHPTEEVLQRLRDSHIPFLRTDEVGSIRFSLLEGKWFLGTQKALINGLD